MSVRVTANDRLFARKLAMLRGSVPRSSRLAAVKAGELFTDAMEIYARRDTNRYVRAWQVALNKAASSAGVGSARRAPLVVKPGKHREQIIREMVDRIERASRYVEEKKGVLQSWYDSVGRRPDAWYRKKERQIAKLQRRIEKQVEALNHFRGDDTALAFNVSTWGHGGGRSITSVRNKVYGGEGSVLMLGPSKAILSLKNMEPHARIVERRYRTKAVIASMLRSTGLKSVKDKALRAMLASLEKL